MAGGALWGGGCFSSRHGPLLLALGRPPSRDAPPDAAWPTLLGRTAALGSASAAGAWLSRRQARHSKGLAQLRHPAGRRAAPRGDVHERQELEEDWCVARLRNAPQSGLQALLRASPENSLSRALRPTEAPLAADAPRAADFFIGRSDVQCLHRWQKVLNPALVKGPWTPEARLAALQTQPG